MAAVPPSLADACNGPYDQAKLVPHPASIEAIIQELLLNPDSSAQEVETESEEEEDHTVKRTSLRPRRL